MKNLIGRLRKDYDLRTVIFAVVSFCISASIAVFDLTFSLLGKSIWYGALAAYYFILAFLRGSILFRRRSAFKKGEKDFERKRRDARSYYIAGWLLNVLILALSAAAFQMVRDNRAFEYAGLAIYAAAAYAFYKIVMAIVNLFRARATDDFTVRAIRNINFADALVSILALQTAMLQTFSDEGTAINAPLFNAITGAAVCLTVFAIALHMIVKGKKRMAELGLNKEK